jgi:NADH-quinone oxidoreductase subunit F
MSKNLSELSGRKGISENLFEKLGEASNSEGTPSKEKLDELAEEFLMGKANTYGTITAYDFMKPENKGKKAYVCNGSACVCAGTQENIVTELEKKFDANEIGHMTCLGRCHENSAFNLDGKNYSGNAINSLDEIIKNSTAIHDKYSIKSNVEILTSIYQGFDSHYEVLKNALAKDSLEILEEIKKSGIRGRGGAGFPMGFKWESCRNEQSTEKFIICNADEGDPGAYSDRYLLEQQPHSVLLGMMIAGYCTHANWGVLYIRAEYPESVEIIQNAIDELRANNLLGENINGSDFNFDFKIIKAQGA